MLRSDRRLLAGLALAAGLALGGPAVPVAAQSMPLVPAGVAMPVAGIAGVVVSPIVVVPTIGIGTSHARIDKERSHSRERADITIGGE